MFIVVLTQGGGCDHTIECGTKVLYLHDAKTMEEAIDELSNDYAGFEGDIIEYFGEGEIDTCDICEVLESVDFMEIHKKNEIIRANKETEEEEIDDKERRRERYEELKKEFENEDE